MFLSRFACFILILTPFLSYSKKEQPIIIKTIHIQTSNPHLKKSLEAHLKDYLGYPHTQAVSDEIRQTIASYLMDNKYRNSYIQEPAVQYKNRQSSITFPIRHPYQYHFILRNNNKIQTAHLIKAMNFNELANEFNLIQTVSQRVKNYYLSLGFDNVQIQTQTSEDKKNFIKTTYLHIKEGLQYTIRKFSIKGSLSRSEDFYKNLFFSYASIPLRSRLYSSKDLDTTLDRMLNHLRRSGFLNVEVYYKNIQKKKNFVFIEIFINENSPLQIKTLKISGNKQFSNKQIIEFMGIKEGDTLSLETLDVGISQLAQAYLDKGFFNAVISDQEDMLNISESLKEVDIHINIQEGFKAFIHDIQVKGNKKVSSKFIIQTSRLKRNTYLTREDVQKARDFIDSLAMFSNIQVETLTPQKNKTTVVIEVEEKKFRFLRTSIGASTKNIFSIRAPIEYTEKRFLGFDSHAITLRAQAGTNIHLLNAFSRSLPTLKSDYLQLLKGNFLEYNAFASYQKHQFFNTHFSSHISFSVSDNIFTLNQPDFNDIEMNSDIEWIKSNKFTLHFEKKFNLRTQLNIKLFELDLKESRTVQNFTQASDHKKQIIPSTGLSLTLDERNHIFYPTSGQLLTAALNYSGPILGTDPTVHFIKINSKYRFYIPFFNNNLVWAQSIEGGYAHRIPPKGIPISELFILGGIDSLRGFDRENDRVPNQQELQTRQATDVIHKSSAYFLIKNELRFPIYKDILRGGVFYDGGAVYLTDTPMKQPYRHSAGLSLHYGLLVVDLSFKLNPSSYTIRDIQTNTEVTKKESLFHIGFYIGAF